MSNQTRYFTLRSGDVLAVSSESSALNSYINTMTDVTQLVFAIANNWARALFRIYVLYPDDTIAYEIPSEHIQEGGSYSEGYQNGQRRQLSFTVYNEDGLWSPDIDHFWVGTRLRLDMGVELLSGETIWAQKGVYIVTSAGPSESPSGRTVAIQASDKFQLFESGRGILGSTVVVPVGTDAYSLVRSILYTDAGNHMVLDQAQCIWDQSFDNRKIEAEITKSAGDSLSSLLQDVAKQLSAEVFYNSLGQLVFAPINQVTLDVDKPIVAHYETEKGDLAQLDFSFDYSQIVNRVVVIGTTSSGGTFIHTAVNDDAASPLCYQRIGYHTGQIINDSNIYSMQLAKERAEYELRQSLILKSSINLSVLASPFLEVNNLITISDEFYGLNRERFLISNVSCSLDYSNTMSLSASNIRNLPFLT